VQDNLNTHTKASLYEAFPAAEARRLAERLSQRLDHRIPGKQTLIDEIAAWENDRNAYHAKADRQLQRRTLS
jgi:hypothetical protein